MCLKLHLKLVSSTSVLLEQATETASKFWIALAKGAIGKITVKSFGWPDEVDFRTYKLEVISGNIDDQYEPNDSIQDSKLLEKDIEYSAYMAGVLDADGKKKGLKDWFFIKHENCAIDCMEVLTKQDPNLNKKEYPYYLEYQELQDNGGLTGCNNSTKK